MVTAKVPKKQISCASLQIFPVRAALFFAILVSDIFKI
jgi:hypothetical protein